MTWTEFAVICWGVGSIAIGVEGNFFGALGVALMLLVFFCRWGKKEEA